MFKYLTVITTAHQGQYQLHGIFSNFDAVKEHMVLVAGNVDACRNQVFYVTNSYQIFDKPVGSVGLTAE